MLLLTLGLIIMGTGGYIITNQAKQISVFIDNCDWSEKEKIFMEKRISKVVFAFAIQAILMVIAIIANIFILNLIGKY